MHHLPKAAIGICMFIVGCGGNSADINNIYERQLAQQQIAQDLTPAHNANKFMCIRLPPSGTDVVLVVMASKEIPTANALMRRYKIPGNVEVRTPYEYNMSVEHLGEQIEAEQPKMGTLPKRINVAYGILYGALTCPKANIQLGVKGEVPPQTIEWARSVRAHYGSDRVRYGYETPLPDPIAHIRVPPGFSRRRPPRHRKLLRLSIQSSE